MNIMEMFTIKKMLFNQNCCSILSKITFLHFLHQQFTDEVGKFVISWCQVNSECCIPKIIKTVNVSQSYSKNKKCSFETQGISRSVSKICWNDI